MSLEREARVLIVDDQREVARVLRTSLELSEQGYFVVDVPSGEEALLELGHKFDVIVSDYRLPGMTGPELLRRVQKVQSDVKMILISGSPMQEVKAALGDLEVFRVFEKPIDTTAFVEAMNIAVYGEQNAAKLKVKEETKSLVPIFDETQVLRELSSLHVALGSRGMALINRSGKVLLKEGSVDDVPRFNELVVLLARNFTTTSEISMYLGDEPSTPVHYYDGNWYDIYALSVGPHFFIAVIFPGGSQKAMGPVLRYGKPAVSNIISIIGDGAAAPGLSVPEKEKTEAAVAAPITTEKAKKVAPPPEPAEPETTKTQEPELSLDMLVKEGEEIEALDLDFDDLSLDLDSDLGDLDGFWEEAGMLETKVSDDALSLDEAVELGLIPKDTEIEKDD